MMRDESYVEEDAQYIDHGEIAFKINNKDFQRMLEMMKVDTLFPYCIIGTKNQKLYSSQTEACGYAFRFALFDKGFFESIENKEGAIKIDAELLLKLLKVSSCDTVFTVKYPSPESKYKLQVKGGQRNINIYVDSIEKEELKEDLIFKMDKGTPVLKPDTDKIRLENTIVFNPDTFKNVAKDLKGLDTEFTAFNVDKDKKLEIRVGDLHDISSYDIYKPEPKSIDVKGVINAIYTKGIVEIANTITEDVKVYLKSATAAWFSCVGKNYRWGVLLPPHTPEEEEENP